MTGAIALTAEPYCLEVKPKLSQKDHNTKTWPGMPVQAELHAAKRFVKRESRLIVEALQFIRKHVEEKAENETKTLPGHLFDFDATFGRL